MGRGQGESEFQRSRTIGKDYGEERFVIIGMADGQVLLFVAYTERGERIRIISARRATEHEEDDYFEQNASTDVH
ncbi:MAG TPA: BrnT family toxin [Bryobacteraceae bacterium]|jgi:uncharacterized DUF497 family protein|nr:BrnT family toxin [Bryobacteraceae bacterium]